MALVEANEIGIREIGRVAAIPNNDVARLMYYLDCVCSAIQYTDNDIHRYRNYQNWSSLPNDDVRVLWILCLALSPDEFEGKVFFQSDDLCGDCGNMFFEITQICNQLVVVESIVIAGRSRQVNQIMAYRMSWMQQNYIEPVQNIAQRIQSQQAIAVRLQPTPQSSGCIIL